MYSKKEKQKALRVYRRLHSVRCAAKAIGASEKTVKQWVKEYEHPKTRKNGKKYEPYGEDVRNYALFLVNNGKSASEVADIVGVSAPSVIQRWCNGGGTKRSRHMKDNIKYPTGEEPAYSGFDGDLDCQVKQLQLENDILRGVVDILKADSLSKLTNREKTLLINKLRQETNHTLKELTVFLKISKSSYEYQCKVLQRADKYIQLRRDIKRLFRKGKSCWGYRTIWAKLRNEGIIASEKVVRRIMREEDLEVIYRKRRKAYSSYKGEISKAPENLVCRNFRASKPNKLWLTDITEFKLPNEQKCYLSPIVDCFDGKLISWRIGIHPNSELANGALIDACETLEKNEHPICHSDRGVHYRGNDWINICNEYGVIRSMSKKGCSPDNAACEGVFGRIKNEFFYYRDWSETTIEEFMQQLDMFLVQYNESRVKKSLGWLSPNQYRRSLGLAVIEGV